jgi:hypothetical protein
MSSTKQPQLQPPSIIDPILADQRIDYFTKTKKAVLDGIIRKPEIDHIRYEVPVFLQLLNFLTNGPRKYSGLRVYFASHLLSATDSGNQYIPAGCENNLTLIFVPTLAVTKGNTVFNGDDLDNCFIIAGNQLVRLSNAGNNKSGKDTASNWISHYQEKLPAMNQDGARVTRNAAFNDTKSLWYRMAIFVDSQDQDGQVQPGLVSYIQDLLKDPVNPLSAIVARMGCYTPTDKSFHGLPLEYQMTLLFELHLQNNEGPNPVVLATKRRPVVHADSATVGTHANPESDTGFPCPPDECLGSLLPAAS